MSEKKKTAYINPKIIRPQGGSRGKGQQVHINPNFVGKSPALPASSQGAGQRSLPPIPPPREEPAPPSRGGGGHSKMHINPKSKIHVNPTFVVDKAKARAYDEAVKKAVHTQPGECK